MKLYLIIISGKQGGNKFAKPVRSQIRMEFVDFHSASEGAGAIAKGMNDLNRRDFGDTNPTSHTVEKVEQLTYEDADYYG